MQKDEEMIKLSFYVKYSHIFWNKLDQQAFYSKEHFFLIERG